MKAPVKFDLSSHSPCTAERGVLACLLMCASTTTMAAGPSDWRMKLDGGAVKQFESSLDSGGDFDIDRYFVRISATRNIGNAWNSGISLGYEESRYTFGGGSGFGGIDPWGKIRQFRASVPIRYRAGNNWSYIGIPSLRYSGESGASSSDSRQWGLIAAAAYRFSDRLTIGPGFGVNSGIEDSTSVFPILFIDWKIADTLSLKTGGGLAASRGPGVSLDWTPTQRWSLSLGLRYEETRFRLDEEGPVPSGVGQDQSIPVALSAKYMPTPDVELSLLGGMKFSGELRLEDASGNSLDESDYDNTSFAGAVVTVRF